MMRPHRRFPCRHPLCRQAWRQKNPAKSCCAVSLQSRASPEQHEAGDRITTSPLKSNDIRSLLSGSSYKTAQMNGTRYDTTDTNQPIYVTFFAFPKRQICAQTKGYGYGYGLRLGPTSVHLSPVPFHAMGVQRIP